MSKSLFTQILIYFMLPLVLAISHSFVGIKVMSILVEMMGDINIFATSLIAGGMLVLIYGGYFLVTFLNARKMI